MTIERRNPLPVGRYWVDAIGDEQMSELAGWFAANREAVQVRGTEHDDGQPATVLGITPERPPSDWYLFQVQTPVVWKGPGFPTIAADSVTGKADTVQRPDYPLDPSDRIMKALDDVGTGTKVALGLLGILALGFGVAWLVQRSPDAQPTEGT